jgi:polysaccharide transporter, PST family
LTNLFKNRIFKNFAALSAVQVVNYLVPLLVVPLVLRVIGIERFGVVAFMQSLALILAGLCDYGFAISATRRVSVHRNDNTMLAGVFSRVISTKLLLFVLVVLLMIIVHFIFPQKFGNSQMMLATLIMVLGNVLLPQWFFLGIEQMRFITYLNTASKLLYLFLIVLLLRQPQADYLVLLLLGLCNIMAAVAAYYIIMRRLGFPRLRWSNKAIWEELTTGRPLFISSLSTTIIVNANTFILGLFVQGASLGYFGVAEKIMQALQQLLSTFSQATFPAVCSQATQPKPMQAIREFFKKHFTPLFVAMPIILLLVALLAKPITSLMTGYDAPEATFYLQLMMVIPFVIMLNIPPSQLLLAFNFNHTYQQVFLLAAAFNVIMNLMGAYYLGVTGTIMAMATTHLLLTTSLYVSLKYLHPNHFIFQRDTKNNK